MMIDLKYKKKHTVCTLSCSREFFLIPAGKHNLYVAKYIFKQKYPAYLEVHGFTTKSSAGRTIRKPHVSQCFQCMKQLIHVHVC